MMGGRALALAGWMLLAALFGGCGSGDGPDDVAEGPLPTGVDDPRAYTERFLAHNPRAQLQPEHLAIVRVEPIGGDDGDTCAERDGIDCLPYALDEETQVTLSVGDGVQAVGRVAVVDASGATVLAADAGGASVTAMVPAGEYVVELTHVFAGDADAAEQTVFLQPGDPGADAEPVPAAVAIAPGAPPASPLRLEVTHDCLHCNFSRSTLHGQRFDGVSLIGSVFDRASMLDSSFRGAQMDSCSLLDLGPPLEGEEEFAFHADFTGAVMVGSHFSFRKSVLSPFSAIFRHAILDGTIWEKRDADANGCEASRLCSIVAPDFRNASLRSSHFAAVRFGHRVTDPEAQCTFQGADLSGADFRANPPMAGIGLTECRFDREPESGHITVLKGANLSGAAIYPFLVDHGGDLSGADLSGAILENANLGGNRADPPRLNGGANLVNANLTGARITGARLTGANLSHATITGIVPATFNGFDLRLTNFAGVDLAGIDLTQTDFSPAASFAGGTPRFVGAKLSDGVHGVSFAGQKFPNRFTGLKGLDLTAATLNGAGLVEADLSGTTLNQARMVGVNLNFANLHGAKLRGAQLGVEPGREGAAAVLHGAFMTDVDLTDADLRSVDLTAAHIYGDASQALFLRTRLDSADLSDSICSGARFSGTLSNAVFERAQLVNTVFNGATLTGAKFLSAYLQGADFSNAIGVTGVVLTNAAVASSAGTWSFRERDGTPFTLRYEATKLGPLATDASVVCPNAVRGPCCPNGDLVACAHDTLKPKNDGPYPPIPDCVPKPPRYDNCLTPVPTATPRP
jgi:uncharacterized protein YjbI with pentapeptide repeats